MTTSKNIKYRLLKFFTQKLVIGVTVLTLGFIVFSLYNISKNLSSDPDKQQFFRGFVLSIIIYLSLITLLLIAKLVIERLRKISGSKLRFKLTLFFILISLFPAVILSISSNYLINEAMKRTNLGKDLIKPLEKSLKFYRDTLSSKIIKQVKQVLSKREKIPLKTFLKTPDVFKFSEVEIAVIFKSLKNNIQTINIKNNTGLNKKAISFFTQYFDNNELEQPIIHMISNKKWIIFTIKELYKKSGIYFMCGNVLNKKNIAVAEGIQAILDKYNKIRLISSSLTRDFNFFIILITLPVVLTAVIIGFYFASAFTKPLNSLIDGTKKISNGLYGYSIEGKGGDELGQLIKSFNLMSKELFANKNRLFEAEKLAAWREVAKKLAHEVKNPLTPIKLASERLQRSYYKDKTKFEKILTTCSNTISEEVDRLRDLVNEFSNFARFPQTNFKNEDINGIIKSFIEMYKETNEKLNLDFKTGLKSHEKNIRIDKNQFKQVIINLIDNAFEAGATSLKIETAVKKKENKRFIQILFSDNGEGIPEKYRDNLFEPHFTSKKRGTGLGLSIVKNIVHEHNGNIYFETKINQGTVFIIELPYKWRDDVN